MSVDLSGRVFGRLTVIEPVSKEKGRKEWLCNCTCGNTKIIQTYNLLRGKSKSCGCLHNELLAQRNAKHGDAPRGSKHFRLYAVWSSMKNRCYNKNESAYERYGARGITVCDEWLHSYEVFKTWAMSRGYNENAHRGECTIDRIDNNGCYSPANCKFSTFKEQNNNRRPRRTKAEIEEAKRRWGEDA